LEKHQSHSELLPSKKMLSFRSLPKQQQAAEI